MKKARHPLTSVKFGTSSSIHTRREHSSLGWVLSFTGGQAGHTADILAVAEILDELRANPQGQAWQKAKPGLCTVTGTFRPPFSEKKKCLSWRARRTT